MDSTTREAGTPSPSPLSPPRPSVPSAPSTLWLVRWALVLHTGLWVLVTLAHAVALAAGTASASSAGSWLRPVTAIGMALGLGVTGYRIGGGRPVAWMAAVLLQVVAAAGYGELTLALVSDGGQSLAPDLVTLLVGVPLVLVTLAGVALTAGRSMRAYCSTAQR